MLNDSKVKIRQGRGLFATGARVFGRRDSGVTLVDRKAEVVVATDETHAQQHARGHLLRCQRGQGIGGNYNNVAVTTLKEQEVDDYGRIGGVQDPMVEVNERHEENLEETMNKDRDPTVVMKRRNRIKAVKHSEREQRRRFEEEQRKELQQKKMAEEETYKEWIHQKKDAAQRERMQEENKLKASQEREERNYNFVTNYVFCTTFILL